METIVGFEQIWSTHDDWKNERKRTYPSRQSQYNQQNTKIK